MADSAVSQVKDSRPSVVIEGQRDGRLTAAMVSLLVAESHDGFARCEMVFGNWGGDEKGGFQHFDRRRLEFGKAFKLTLGDGTLFEGRISALTADFPEGSAAQIGICAEDRFQDLRMTRRTRSFENASLADVLRKIASDHGLTPAIDASGETYKLLAQVNQSDLAFARDLARREDAQVWVEGTRLRAAQRASRTGATLELAWAGKLREFHVEADLAHQRTKLSASGWNVADKKIAKNDAGEAAVSAELGGGEGGATILKRAFGDRPDTLAHGTPASDAQARALAEASYRHLARRFVVARGVAETRPDLRVGTKVTVKGVGPLFEGDYTVTDTAIRYDGQKGLRTEFCCDRPAIGRP
jgi:Bacteriophage probable baseplate hub protein